MVENVATLVEVDEASLSWNRLEYARFQVRMLKSSKVELSKGFRINGCLYNITLVEEANYYDGVKSRCNCDLSLGWSSGSVSSFETFVEDSLCSAKLSSERGGDGEGSRGWPEENRREEKGWSMNKTKMDLEKEGAEDLVSGQGKSDFSFTKKEVSLRGGGGAEEGTAASALQHVNVACGAIQSPLVDLVKEVESFDSFNESPMLSEAHLQVIGTKAHVDTYAGRVSLSGKSFEGVCATSVDGGQPATSESPWVEHPLKHLSLNVSKGGACSSNRVKNSLSKSSSCRKNSISEGYQGDLGKKTGGVHNGEEEHIEVDDRQTPDRVRHLRALWEQGGRTIQRRCRSKGGTGSLHSGNRYPTRSRSLSYALSDSEIVECNNRIRKEVVESESVRLWGLAKRLGTTCPWGDDMMLQEVEVMEDRDRQVLSKMKKGTKSGCL